MKILVVQTIYLGDLVLTLPLVQELKKNFPDATIEVLANAEAADILRNHPDVADVICIDKKKTHRGMRGIFALSKEVQANHYDLALVLPGSVRTAMAIRLAGVPRRIGTDQSSGMRLLEDKCKFPGEGRQNFGVKLIYYAERLWRLFGGKDSFVSLLFTDVVQLDGSVHATVRYCALLRPLGASVDEAMGPRLYPAREEAECVDRFFAGLPPDAVSVGIAPGSVWPTKRWPAEYFAQLIEQLPASIGRRPVRFFLIGSADESDISQRIVNRVSNKTVVDCCGKLSPLQSAEAIRRCRVLVTNDAAPLHFASAVGTPCVAIFGPTDPGFGFGPLTPSSMVVERSNLWCRPCTPHGGLRCPIGTHECMWGVGLDMVTAAVKTVLGI